jgi:hypothetical protein
MQPPRIKKFVEDRKQLDDYRLSAKQLECPHCRRVGNLIGHGFLKGYAERTQEREVRGRRFFCSNRFRRRGCGRTFSVLLASVMKRFVVRARLLSRFAEAVLQGRTRRAAWAQAASGALSLSTGYRLWRRLTLAQSRLRTLAAQLAAPPASSAAEPFGQLLSHLRCAVGEADCVFEGFQSAFQAELFN